MQIKKTLSSINSFAEKHVPRFVPVMIAVVLLAIFGLGGFFIYNRLTDNVVDDHNPDPPLSLINRNYPLSQQWLPTQVRTSAIQITDLFDENRAGTGLYPLALACGADHVCQDIGVTTFRDSYPMLYARAMAINAASIPTRFEQERRDAIRQRQLASLRQSIAALEQFILDNNPSIEHGYYSCALLAPVSALPDLTPLERQTLESVCFNSIYEADFFLRAEDFPYLPEQIELKLSALLSDDPATNFNWQEDFFYAVYTFDDPEGINTPLNVGRHAFHATDKAANFFWPGEIHPECIRGHSQGRTEPVMIKWYYSIALSDFHFLQTHVFDEGFQPGPSFFLANALATQRMIELYEYMQLDTALLTSFRNQLIRAFNVGFNYDSFMEMPLDQLADLSFSADQLNRAGVLGRSDSFYDLRRAVVDRQYLGHDGEFNGYFDGFIRNAQGNLVGNFDLTQNALLSAFIFNNFQP